MSCGIQEYRSPCNRTTCKSYRHLQEMPVRDIPVHPVPSSLPDPPTGQSPDWELQYCQWSGWTWVKKTDKETLRQESNQASKPAIQPVKQGQTQPEPSKSTERLYPPEEKKKGGCFNCFKKKKPPPPPVEQKPSVKTVPTAAATSPPPPPPPKKSDTNLKASDDFDDCCCCCCCMDYDPCACACLQVCCPCMQHQVCCACVQNQLCSCMSGERKRAECKCTETQTVREVKEQATKMSEIYIPKQPQVKACNCRRRRCRCRRPVCCRCVRNTCPCVQPLCCPCQRNKAMTTQGSRQSLQANACPANYSAQVDGDKPVKSTVQIDNDPIINYYLNRNPRKPNAIDFLNFKSNNFSTLQKSLDILLKNNINIMNLFDDKKELRCDTSPVSCYTSNHTITCLSSDNVKKKSDPEHCKLLTAVCDAILSSHKFDNDKLDSVSRPKSNHKRCESDSFNRYSTRGFVQRILSELNFPSLKKSDDEVNIYKEVGVQVGNNYQAETWQAKRSLTKLVRNKSRVLTAPRFPKKVENLKRNIDLLKSEGYDVKTLRRGLSEIKFKGSRTRPEENKTHLVGSGNENSVNKVKSSFEDTTKRSPRIIQQESSSGLEKIEHLLNTIEYINSSSSGCCRQQNSDSTQGLAGSFARNSEYVHLLDDTSPPFTDADLFFNGEVNDANEEREDKGSYGT